MGEPNIDKIIEKIEKSPPESISKQEVLFTLELVNQILIKENNVIRLSGPTVVVGDIHGQLFDFLEIFRIEAPPPENQYLFLGDYVDRGYYSLEVLMYLICLKIKYPNRVFLLRGNHECFTITRTYGFYRELLLKFGEPSIYQKCCEMFNFLPLSALIDGQVFGIHGGLSPSIHLVDQVEGIDRFQEPLNDGPISDLLWSDPNASINGFKISGRGLGYQFGGDVCKKFAHLNRLSFICRAHQLAMKGYEILFDGVFGTVWSAPNYMYRSNNLASVMTVSKEQGSYQMRFNIFGPVSDSEQTVPETNEVLSQYFL